MKMTSDILRRSFDFVSSKLEPFAGRYSVVLALVLAFGSGFALKFARKRWRIRTLAKKRKEKREACHLAIRLLADKIQKEGKVSPERREEISTWTLNQLTSKLQLGEVQAAEVLETYQHKALEAHHKTNCLIEPIWESELQALECDLADKRKGPLHGVPVSLKDNFGLQGYDSTVGCAEFIDKPCKTDAVVVKVLKKQGAIPFVKTNIPQTMISWETTNPIFGPTTNPYDPTRGVGGSSGGEGALLASEGSLLGFGSDIGGSIRIPAALCGVYGLKPTFGRLSSLGTTPVGKGQQLVCSSYGPMARDVDSLVTVMRALLVPYMFELDSTVPPLPFNDELYQSKRPLRIGYYAQDGWFPAATACERGVHVAKDALQNMGHELIPVAFPDMAKTAGILWASAVFGDAGQHLLDILKYDALDSAMAMAYTGLSVSICLKKILAFVLKPLAPKLAISLHVLCGASSVSEWWQLVDKTKIFRQSMREEWRKRQLDAVICPGFGCPALPLGDSAIATGAASYMHPYNVLDFPAGVVPVTKVTDQDVANMKDYNPTDLWQRTVKKGMNGAEGLPVGVQVVTLPWQEELCLRVMKELETALKQG